MLRWKIWPLHFTTKYSGNIHVQGIRQYRVFGSMHGPSNCSMKIPQGVRDFTAQQGVDEQTALRKGMKKKAVEFVKRGGQLYRKD